MTLDANPYPSSKASLWALPGLLFLGLLIWGSQIGRYAEFWNDDYALISDIYNRGGVWGLKWYWPWAEFCHRPLGRDVLALWLQTFGEDPLAFHWMQLCIHLASSLCLWLVIWRMTRTALAATTGTTLFLMTSAAFDPINWSGALFDLLAAFFSILTLLGVVWAIPPVGKRRPWLLLLAGMMALLAARAKEHAVLLAALLPLYLLLFGSIGARFRAILGKRRDPDSLPVSEHFSKLIPEGLFIMGLLVMLGLVGSTNLHSLPGQNGPDAPYFMSWSPAVILKSYGYFLTLFAIRPTNLGGMAPVAAVLLIPLPFIAAWRLRSLTLLFGWVWCLLFLFPMARLENHYMYPFYAYLPMLGAGIGLGAYVAGIRERRLSAGKSGSGLTLACIAAVVLLTLGEAAWLQWGRIPCWTREVHVRNRKMLEALHREVPRPDPHTHFVFVIAERNPFSLAVNPVLRVRYKDETLSGERFDSQAEARKYVRTLSNNYLYLVWNEERFNRQEVE